MSWLKPLEGKSWWEEPAIRKTGSSWPKEKLEAVRKRVEQRMANARKLVAKYKNHTEVAKMMGVSQSTVTRWVRKG